MINQRCLVALIYPLFQINFMIYLFINVTTTASSNKTRRMLLFLINLADLFSHHQIEEEKTCCLIHIYILY